MFYSDQWSYLIKCLNFFDIFDDFTKSKSKWNLFVLEQTEISQSAPGMSQRICLSSCKGEILDWLGLFGIVNYVESIIK